MFKKLTTAIAALAIVLIPNVALADVVVNDNAKQICNDAVYVGWDPAPVRTCYRALAAELGWWPVTIDDWQWFLVDSTAGVIGGEANYCWNIHRGEFPKRGQPCTEITTRTQHSDSGFGQITGTWHGPTGYLCVHHGYCGRDSITESPYTSMRSLLLLVEIDGSNPWCWNPRIIAWHRCSEAPDR